MSFCKWPEGCENYTEGATDYCGTHNHLIRKKAREELKLKKVYTLPKPTKPINKISKKEAKKLREYTPKRKAHLEKHPDCQIRLMGICQNNRETNSIHHSAKRGKNLTNEETFLTACVPCHNHIEFVMSAEERRERGFLK